jgi:hypothetical protein
MGIARAWRCSGLSGLSGLVGLNSDSEMTIGSRLSDHIPGHCPVASDRLLKSAHVRRRGVHWAQRSSANSESASTIV